MTQKNKLVRDLILNIIEKQGKKPVTRILNYFLIKKPFLFLLNNAESQHWFGGRDSNPDSWYQKPKSYR